MIDLNQPFSFNIDVFLGCNGGGADGIAFVLQPISTSLGSTGGGIGYQNISPSFAVEFDTCFNSTYSDPWYNHVAIQKNGNLNHTGPSNLAGPVGFLQLIFLQLKIVNGTKQFLIGILQLQILH